MKTIKNINDIRLAIIGLGYVGLPLVVEFGKVRSVIGFDIDQNRINKLNQGIDETLEVSNKELTESRGSQFSYEPHSLKDSNVYIVTVPTPIDTFKRPDLNPLIKASETIGAHLKQGDIVVYESTVYPGCVEENCVPVLEKISGLKFNNDFFAGYSPERINPGDKEHRLINIKKVTSGSTPEVADMIDELYKSIIVAGTHKASSIKVAEAAKVIENTQRDLNIALINELAMIFNKMDIDTTEVLEAAGTKWNFLSFKPGLVGGHCIGVDPYYLTYKAEMVGHNPEMILAGRRINDSMGEYVANNLVISMIKKKINITKANILILGFTFKEDCPDIRNTRVIDIFDSLIKLDINVEIYDPYYKGGDDVIHENLLFHDELPSARYDAVVIAVGHNEFKELGADGIKTLTKPNSVIFDLKSLFKKNESDLRL